MLNNESADGSTALKMGNYNRNWKEFKNCCDLKHREFTFYLCSWYKTNL